MESWILLLQKIKHVTFTQGLTSFVNPYSMLILKDMQEVVAEIDNWYVDGISLVNKINSKYGKKIERASFDETSLAPLIFKFVIENKLRLAIIGTEKDIIDKAAENISIKHGVTISYYRNGYFLTNKDREECLDYLVSSNIDVVVCGMGTPLQEQFLIDLKNRNWNGYGYTCGGYLHQMARSIDYYPPFFNRFNLRWLYRIYDEPNLIKRYIIDYPSFFFKFSKLK